MSSFFAFHLFFLTFLAVKHCVISSQTHSWQLFFNVNKNVCTFRKTHAQNAKYRLTIK